MNVGDHVLVTVLGTRSLAVVEDPATPMGNVRVRLVRPVDVDWWTRLTVLYRDPVDVELA